MSLEQCQAMSDWADELVATNAELSHALLNISRAIPGDTPGLTALLNRAAHARQNDPRKAPQTPIARSTERRPPPYFSRVSFHAPAPATPISDDELDSLPHDDDFRRMSTMPPAETAAETYPSDRVALEILGGVPG